MIRGQRGYVSGCVDAYMWLQRHLGDFDLLGIWRDEERETCTSREDKLRLKKEMLVLGLSFPHIPRLRRGLSCDLYDAGAHGITKSRRLMPGWILFI